MQRYALGDSDAFEELYRRHSRQVYGFLQRKLRGSSASDDVFQEVWMRLHRHRGKYDPTLPFIPWLFTLTRSALVDTIRRLQRKEEERAADLETIAAAEFSGSGVGPSIYNELLAALSSREQEVMELHYQHGYPFREIAERLNMAPAAVRKVSSRALLKLRAVFGPKV